MQHCVLTGETWTTATATATGDSDDNQLSTVAEALHSCAPELAFHVPFTVKEAQRSFAGKCCAQRHHHHYFHYTTLHLSTGDQSEADTEDDI